MSSLGKENRPCYNVPPGCTSCVQPFDVSVNMPFKHFVREQFERHLDENLEHYVEGYGTWLNQHLEQMNKSRIAFMEAILVCINRPRNRPLLSASKIIYLVRDGRSISSGKLLM